MNIKFKESEILELKKSTSELKEAVISIAAILNKHSKGGVYFGAKNNGAVVGQNISEKTVREVSRTISENIEPKIYPIVNKVVFNAKNCIKVEFQGHNTPYFAYGRAYIRVADEDRQLSAKEIENFILKKNKDKLRWDNQICEKAKTNDISSAKLKTFLKGAELRYDSIENGLKKLDLTRNEKLINTAVMLFGKNPQKFFPNAKLRCALFANEDTALILDRQEYEGDIFFLIEKAQEYILKNIHIGMKIEGLYRRDIPEINKEAIREAIINAFCHRDYYEYDSVNVAVFKDRVEVRNPGLLYGGLTIKKITKEMVSERRNELIAQMLHRIHYVEKWGRGIKLILSREPQTKFKEVGKQFIVVFKRKEELEEKQASQIGLAEGLVERLAESQRKILAKVKDSPYISKKELSDKIGISTTAIDKNISQLKKKGLLKRIGPDKGGHWEVTG